MSACIAPTLYSCVGTVRGQCCLHRTDALVSFTLGQSVANETHNLPSRRLPRPRAAQNPL